MPKLTINRITGDIEKKEGEKFDDYRIADNYPALQVLLTLAKRPRGGLFNLNVLRNVAIKAGANPQSGMPGVDQIEYLKVMLDQTTESYQYIKTVTRGNGPDYILNVDVEIVDEPKREEKAAAAEKPVQQDSHPAEKSTPMEKPKIIILDKNNRMLTIDDKTEKLQPYEFVFISYLYDHPGEKFSARDLDKILLEAGYSTKTNTAISNLEKRFGRRFFTGDRIRGKKAYWSLEAFNDTKPENVTVSGSEPKGPKEVKEDPYILTEDEAEILLTLIATMDNTTIFFNENNQVTFKYPDWIKDYKAQLIDPVISDENEELHRKRAKLLEKAKEILRKTDEDSQLLARQSEYAGLLLQWMQGDSNVAGEIQTKTKALTLEGLIAFLLSSGKKNETTTITDKFLYLKDHKSVYRVPKEHIVEIKEKPVFRNPKSTEATPDSQLKKTQDLTTTKKVESVKTTTPLPIEPTPAVTDVFYSEDDRKAFDKRVKLLEKVKHHIERILQIPQLSDGVYITQLHNILRDLTLAFTKKFVDNGTIMATNGGKGKDFLPLEEIVLLLLLKEDQNRPKKDVNKLRKIIREEIEKRTTHSQQ